MRTNRLFALCLSVAILTIGFLTIPRVWAYTSAEYRTGTGAYRIVDAPGTGQAPFVYCTVSPATFSIKATNGATGRQNVTLTCYNNFKHTISLSIACSVSANFAPPYTAPTCASPTTLNSIVAGGSATTPTIQVRAGNTTTTGSYRLNFTITTTGTGLPVDVSVPMSSSFQVTP